MALTPFRHDDMEPLRRTHLISFLRCCVRTFGGLTTSSISLKHQNNLESLSQCSTTSNQHLRQNMPSPPPPPPPPLPPLSSLHVPFSRRDGGDQGGLVDLGCPAIPGVQANLPAHWFQAHRGFQVIPAMVGEVNSSCDNRHPRSTIGTATATTKIARHHQNVLDVTSVSVCPHGHVTQCKSR